MTNPNHDTPNGAVPGPERTASAPKPAHSVQEPSKHSDVAPPARKPRTWTPDAPQGAAAVGPPAAHVPESHTSATPSKSCATPSAPHSAGACSTTKSGDHSALASGPKSPDTSRRTPSQDLGIRQVKGDGNHASQSGAHTGGGHASPALHAQPHGPHSADRSPGDPAAPGRVDPVQPKRPAPTQPSHVIEPSIGESGGRGDGISAS